MIYKLTLFLISTTQNSIKKGAREQEELDFKVDFQGIAIKVRMRNVIVGIFEISKCNNFGQEQYFFISKKFLVATILFSQKQQKSENLPRTTSPSPSYVRNTSEVKCTPGPAVAKWLQKHIKALIIYALRAVNLQIYITSKCTLICSLIRCYI